MPTTKTNKLQALLEIHNACKEGLAWARNFKTPASAWKTCANPDWMLWALQELKIFDDKRARLFACWCVRNTPLADGKTTWDLLTDERSRKAVETAERFAEGQATKEALDAASNAAGDAAGDARNAASNAAWHAAWNAWHAAGNASNAAWHAAGDASNAASNAAWNAANAARNAAWNAAWHAAWHAARAAQCNQIRKMWGNPFKKGK